ncbi:MAG: hypothetical protein JJ913_17145 [Rhizobiaceae bacterium]|nr:hypothetical protein [Rhizobiaceae bacterium]
MRQPKSVAFALTAALWLAASSPALAHPDPGTHTGAVAYLVAAGITVAIFAAALFGGRIVSFLRSAIRSR